MTLRRYAPIFALAINTVACGGGSESTVDKTKGGTLPDMPNLGPSLGNPGSGSGGGSANGGGDNGDCSPVMTGLVRDFQAASVMPGGHPDFETFAGDDASEGIVQDLLD